VRFQEPNSPVIGVVVDDRPDEGIETLVADWLDDADEAVLDLGLGGLTLIATAATMATSITARTTIELLLIATQGRRSQVAIEPSK
jgi:hypothetical protein